ncbi:MAG: glycosyltransferase, partial [Candidatus Peregrinibacteria bacterium]
MKIGVNARWLIKPFTGIGQYTENLFRELAKIDSGNEYVLVVPEEVDVKFGKNVRVEILKEKRLGTAGMKKTWWEQIQVPEFFLKEKVDVVFFTYPCNPWSGDWYKKGVKTIVTVHDCIPWVRKEYRRGVLSKMYHRQTRKAVGKADVVLTVSESSKKEIVKICDVGKGKVKVVYNDAGDVYKKSGGDDKKVLEKWGLKKDKYFLYVGGYDV